MPTTLWSFFFYIWILAEILIAIITRTKSTTHDRGSQLILWLTIVPAITVCEFLRHLQTATSFGTPGWLQFVTLLVLITGLAIRTAAILNLGKSFSANVAIHSTQTLNRTGLHGIVRHPSYLGLLLIFLAIGVNSANWLGLLIALLPTTAAILHRIRIEETALIQTFGPGYALYAKTTKRLIPGVY